MSLDPSEPSKPVIDTRGMVPSVDYQELLKERDQLSAKLLDIQTKLNTSTEIKLSKGADVNLIESIRIDLYYIVTKSEEKCPVCEAMIQMGILDKIRKFNDIIRLPIEKFIFREWKCDPADRFLKRPPYNDSNSLFGQQFYYAVGRGINKYPAMEVWIKVKNQHTIYRVLEGFGRKSEQNTIMFDVIEGLVSFISTLLIQRVASSLDVLKHKENVIGNDPLGDKRRY